MMGSKLDKTCHVRGVVPMVKEGGTTSSSRLCLCLVLRVGLYKNRREATLQERSIGKPSAGR